MKHFEKGKLDEKNYEIVKWEEPIGGSRPRLILKHLKTKQKFILKTYSHNSNEIWAELCASKLGELLNLDIQKVSIKKITGKVKAQFLKKSALDSNWDPLGALIRHAFSKDYEIKYGKWIVGENDPRLKLEDIEKKIREKYYDSDQILEKLSDMIIFDAFIGNMDRHHENWGVIESPQMVIHPKLGQKPYLATLFDHGSSLLFELDERKVNIYLQNLDDFEKNYILGKKYSFFVNKRGQKENVFSLIKWYIDNESKAWGKRFKRSIKKMFNHPTSAIDFDLAKLLVKMPSGYSEERKKLLFESLKRRKDKLISFLT